MLLLGSISGLILVPILRSVVIFTGIHIEKHYDRSSAVLGTMLNLVLKIYIKTGRIIFWSKCQVRPMVLKVKIIATSE